MKLIHLLLCLVFFSLISSCAFAPVNRPDKNKYNEKFLQTKTYNISLEEALKASNDSLEALGFEIQASNISLGLVRTKTLLVNIPKVCDCGTWNGKAINGNADFNFIITLTSNLNNQTSIDIETTCSTTFSGQNLYGATTRRETYDCASCGIYEEEFWATFEKLINESNFKP